MFKTILVPLSGTDADVALLSTSLEFLRPFAGHMECVRVVPSPAALVAQSISMDAASGLLLAEMMRSLEQREQAKTERARITFAQFCKAHQIAQVNKPPGGPSVTAAWREQSGDECATIKTLARFYDAVALAAGQERSGRLPSDDLGEIILSSGRPVLLAPERPISGAIDTIAVAWKDTREAAVAITAAMPLLARATRIEVLSVNEEDGDEQKCLDCSDNIVEQLRWHELNAYGRFVLPAGRSAPQAVLETARGLHADLLVMGAYGRSRFREFLLGGFTRHILKGVDLPVFAAH
jgi:nucleotide-binding universal stress UspA family protein